MPISKRTAGHAAHHSRWRDGHIRACAQHWINDNANDGSGNNDCDCESYGISATRVADLFQAWRFPVFGLNGGHRLLPVVLSAAA